MNRIPPSIFLKAVAWVPALLWYHVIWRFSAQTAAVSGDMSDRLLWRLLHRLPPSFAAADDLTRNTAVEVLSFFERKAAHMFLYFVLALLVWFALSWLLKGKAVRGAVTALLSTGLAALDEFHQTFIPGRSGQLRDVCIDFSGAALALGLVALLLWVGRVRSRMPSPVVSLPALLPGVICLAGLAFGPGLASSPLLLQPLQGLATRFAPDFWSLSGSAQQELLIRLLPITGDVFRLGFCGLLGCGVVLSCALCGLRLPSGVLLSLPLALLPCGAVHLAAGGGNAATLLAISAAGVLVSGIIWAAALLSSRRARLT